MLLSHKDTLSPQQMHEMLDDLNGEIVNIKDMLGVLVYNDCQVRIHFAITSDDPAHIKTTSVYTEPAGMRILSSILREKEEERRIILRGLSELTTPPEDCIIDYPLSHIPTIAAYEHI